MICLFTISTIVTLPKKFENSEINSHKIFCLFQKFFDRLEFFFRVALLPLLQVFFAAMAWHQAPYSRRSIWDLKKCCLAGLAEWPHRYLVIYIFQFRVDFPLKSWVHLDIKVYKNRWFNIENKNLKNSKWIEPSSWGGRYFYGRLIRSSYIAN